MTLAQIMETIARRWYVFAAVLLCAVFFVLAAARVDGVYSVRVSLVFLPPTMATEDTNTLRWSSESLVDYAGVIEREYNGNDAHAPFASTDATLAGGGIRAGTRVFLPNAGGQWSNSFRDPVLVVESVHPEREEAVANLDRVVAEVRAIAEARQLDAGADRESLITLLVSDPAAGVRYWSGSTIRAAAAIMLLGVGVGAAATVVVDRMLSRSRAARPRVAA